MNTVRKWQCLFFMSIGLVELPLLQNDPPYKKLLNITNLKKVLYASKNDAENKLIVVVPCKKNELYLHQNQNTGQRKNA